MATSGQTLNDRINAARYALAGQGLARCVCKATTEEVIGPKKKHLDYLLACTHEPNVSIPQLANLLIERTNHIYWVVVFKALVTVHHLMSYGNERFTQYLASSNYSFELSTFLDKTSARDFSMSTFIRRYSRYINEKALSYRLLAFDLCKAKRGSEGVLRVMPIDRLLKTLPILQNQLDALLEFDCTANDLNNGVINACFMLLFRDLIGLFACHNDGIINLLNRYFTLNKKMCREGFENYKKFLVRTDKVSEFLRVAEAVGIDKDEIPDLRRAPSSLIEALEQHLQNIESNKKILKQQSSSSATNTSIKSGEFSVFGNLTPPSSNSSSSHRPSSPNNNHSSAAFGNSPSNNTITPSADDFAGANFRDDEVRRALEEEARVLSQYGGDGTKANKSRTSTGGSSTTGSNSPKFAVATIPKSIDDLFGDADAFGSTNGESKVVKDNNNSSVFDNLSAPSGANHTNTAKNRPDLNSIRSVASTLEKSNSVSTHRSAGPKKASDELFSLLDTSTTNSQPVNISTGQSLIDSMPDTKSQPTSANMSSPLGSAFGSSPFDLPINGGLSTVMKPGNPFPDISSDFTIPNPLFPAGPAAFQTNPVAPTNQSNNNSVFKPASNAPNYTNLGGLEGFGDLLQPMSSSNKSSSANPGGQSKPSFNPGSSLSTTGLFKGDLDSTLANLAQNLTFEGITKTKK